MKRASIRPLVCPLLVAISAATSTSALAEQPNTPPTDTSTPAVASDDNTRARDLYREGASLYSARQYDQARTTLLEAWSLRHTYDIAVALGQIEIELGRYRDAAEHLDFGIRNFAPVESQQTLEQAKSAFEEVKRRVGILTIDVDASGADIRVDGDPVGKSPLSAPIFVETGPHNIEAQLDDHKTAQTIKAVAGKEQHLTLAVSNAPPTVDAGLASSQGRQGTSSSAAHDEGTPAKKSIIPVFVGGAVALVGLGTGLGFHFAAESEDDDAKSLRDKIGNNGCPNSAPAIAIECKALGDAAKAKDRDRNISTAGFIVGGIALLATGAYFFLWPDAKTSDSPSGQNRAKIRVAGAVVPHAANVWVSGQF